MQNNFLDFLASAEVEEVAPGATGGPRKQRNPNPAILAIRVWKDGSVYPSEALKDKFNLEYPQVTYVTTPVPPKKEGDAPTSKKTIQYPKEPGNGFDVIDSRVWGAYKGGNNALFIAAVPKDAPKVSLFGTCTWDENGKPKTSVMEQGAVTFGEAVLLPAIKDIYGIDLLAEGSEKEFVDMIVFDTFKDSTGKEHNLTAMLSKPLTLVPKRVTRGKDKDKDDYERRENLQIWGFMPSELLNPPPAPTDTEKKEEVKEAKTADAVFVD